MSQPEDTQWQFLAAFTELSARLSQVLVTCTPWNGGAPREVTLLEVVMYPNAFVPSDLVIVQDLGAIDP